jgi:hypothetical protein
MRIVDSTEIPLCVNSRLIDPLDLKGLFHSFMEPGRIIVENIFIQLLQFIFLMF